MIELTTIAELQTFCNDARRGDARVGFVPTMGYFHVGHRSLMDAARAETDVVVVSSFVNPTQFGPTEDLASYPTAVDADRALATAAGVDVMFRPTAIEMYPAGAPNTTVHVAGLTDGMCGAARPTHFDGVTTVVAKLFAIVGPCRAYFGRKDFQQLAVVRRMTADLNLPVEIVGCPLVREPDGLARSSRNAYLTNAEREIAPELFAAVMDGARAIEAGARDANTVIGVVTHRVRANPSFELEYVEIRDTADLIAVDALAGSFVIALAARLGRARLIDNVVVTIESAVAAPETPDAVTVDTVLVDAGVRVPERADADGPPAGVNP